MGGDTPVKLDLKGLKCPLPVLQSRKKLRALQSGDLLDVETTDPLANLDIPHMCNEDGHTLVLCEKLERGHHFIIRRA